MNSFDTDCVILGAGLAGSAVAWQLAKLDPDLRVLVLERESAPATHAASQNAAMIRALVFEDELVRFAIEGTHFWNTLPPELQQPGSFRRTGSLFLASEAGTLETLRRRVDQAREHGLRPEIWSADECRACFPTPETTPVCGGAFTPEDGVADPVGLVGAFLKGAAHASTRLRLRCEVSEILRKGNRVVGVRTAAGEQIRSRTTVLAAGAWSPRLMATAGAKDIGLRPHRRHIFHTVPTEDHIARFDRNTPYVWHLDLQCYLRWEGGGALFSACDDAPAKPGRPEVDPAVDPLVEQRVGDSFPFLLDLPISTRWAGLRTFTPSQNFVLGEDPELPGLFYATGLGGHGVTCAPSAGRVVAEQIVGTLSTAAH